MKKIIFSIGILPILIILSFLILPNNTFAACKNVKICKKYACLNAATNTCAGYFISDQEIACTLISCNGVQCGTTTCPTEVGECYEKCDPTNTPVPSPTPGIPACGTGLYCWDRVYQQCNNGSSICLATTQGETYESCCCPSGQTKIGASPNAYCSGWTVTTPSPSTTPPAISITPPSGCSKKSQGDANCDGIIDSADYRLWRKQFDLMVPPTPMENNANFLCKEGNSSTYFIDMVDFEIWRRHTSSYK